MFGLWVSEYGYENWNELMADLESLRAANFPLDGFVLDLQWFGGISPTDSSQMGSLSWDLENFPDPTTMIAMLRESYGLGIMTIEEPYVAESAEGYADAAEHGLLVRECGEPDCSSIEMNSWWGIGGMVDWTNPDAAAWWHDQRRQPIIDDGVIAHWTDLGEPENFDDRAWYVGFPDFDRHSQADVHNLYNFF
jgi:alpha-glucosidase